MGARRAQGEDGSRIKPRLLPAAVLFGEQDAVVKAERPILPELD
jgi:hypothetical protein